MRRSTRENEHQKRGTWIKAKSPGDSVNHPKHYVLGGIEVIDALEAWNLGFHLGNAVKYIARAEHKGSALVDLKKARWYLEREIARREAAPRDALPSPRGGEKRSAPKGSRSGSRSSG